MLLGHDGYGGGGILSFPISIERKTSALWLKRNGFGGKTRMTSSLFLHSHLSKSPGGWRCLAWCWVQTHPCCLLEAYSLFSQSRSFSSFFQIQAKEGPWMPERSGFLFLAWDMWKQVVNFNSCRLVTTFGTCSAAPTEMASEVHSGEGSRDEELLQTHNILQVEDTDLYTDLLMSSSVWAWVI